MKSGLRFPDIYDWRGCAAVEFDPLKLSGRATVGSTRMDADGVFLNYLNGMSAEEISETFQTDLGAIRVILAFAKEKGFTEVAK